VATPQDGSQEKITEHGDIFAMEAEDSEGIPGLALAAISSFRLPRGKSFTRVNFPMDQRTRNPRRLPPTLASSLIKSSKHTEKDQGRPYRLPYRSSSCRPATSM
jgi:hypothetical protein